jgi:hypothetical protein
VIGSRSGDVAKFDDTQHGRRHFFRKPEQEDRGAYLPTPGVIRKKCERIRATWSKETMSSRSAYPVEPVEAACCRDTDLGLPGAGRRGYGVESD